MGTKGLRQDMPEHEGAPLIAEICGYRLEVDAMAMVGIYFATNGATVQIAVGSTADLALASPFTQGSTHGARFTGYIVGYRTRRNGTS